MLNLIMMSKNKINKKVYSSTPQTFFLLLTSLIAVGKKLHLILSVLVFIDLSLRPDGKKANIS